LTDLGKQSLTQFVFIEQLAKRRHRGGIENALAADIDPDEAEQARTVVDRLFNGQIGQVEPVLDEVGAQHSLQADVWPTIAGWGVIRLDHFAQRRPRHALFDW